MDGRSAVKLLGNDSVSLDAGNAPLELHVKRIRLRNLGHARPARAAELDVLAVDHVAVKLAAGEDT